MKHIDYKTFNSVQSVGHNPNEDRYNYIQEKVGKMVRENAIFFTYYYLIVISCEWIQLT